MMSSVLQMVMGSGCCTESEQVQRERERAREIAEQVVGVRVVAANRLLYVYSASRRTPIASATL